MGKTIIKRVAFKDKFRAAIDAKNTDAQDYGVRTVARALSGGDKQRTETIRRRLNKYLRGEVTPTEPTRREIESVMGLERDSLKSDDEEESDPVALRIAKRARLIAHVAETGGDDLLVDLLDLTRGAGSA